MFDSILVRRHGLGQRYVDAGLLAETLLFYGNVHVLADHSVLVELLRAVGPDNLLELLARKSLTLTFTDADLLTFTTNEQIPMIKFGAAKLTKEADSDKKLSSRDHAEVIFRGVLGNSWKTKRAFKKISERIKFKNVYPGADGPLEFACRMANDKGYMSAAVPLILSHIAPAYVCPKACLFDVMRLPDGFIVTHNLDFIAISAASGSVSSNLSRPMSPADILHCALEASVDMYLASDYASEILATDLTSDILRSTLQGFARRRSANKQAIVEFQDVVLENEPSVREAVNSKQRTFAEYIRVLDKAQKFKESLRTANPDSNILQWYVREISSETWLERLPFKTAKFILTSVVNLGLDHAAALAFDATETFVLDKLFRGWRPHHFVDGPLRRFVSGSSRE